MNFILNSLYYKLKIVISGFAEYLNGNIRVPIPFDTYILFSLKVYHPFKYFPLPGGTNGTKPNKFI